MKVDLKRNPIACIGGEREEKVNKLEGKKIVKMNLAGCEDLRFYPLTNVKDLLFRT